MTRRGWLLSALAAVPVLGALVRARARKALEGLPPISGDDIITERHFTSTYVPRDMRRMPDGPMRVSFKTVHPYWDAEEQEWKAPT